MVCSQSDSSVAIFSVTSDETSQTNSLRYEIVAQTVSLCALVANVSTDFQLIKTVPVESDLGVAETVSLCALW